MKYILLIVALLGIIAASLALREHYRPYGESVCDINDHWDCGIVNHSPYAVLPQGSPHGLPVAVIGIAGYLLLAALALKRAYRLMLALAIPALAFSLYLAHFEASPDKLGVWCLYCAISLGAISSMTLLLIGTLLANSFRKEPVSHREACV
jgi:vitamin-K-epoxide reductase (warfarin-sensitive)